VQLLNRQHKSNVRAVLTVGIVRRIAERDVTELITGRSWFVRAVCQPRGHTNSTVVARINTVRSVVTSGCTIQILEKTLCVAISEVRKESIAQSGTAVPSECLCAQPDESS